jgi:hypothetical protein
VVEDLERISIADAYTINQIIKESPAKTPGMTSGVGKSSRTSINSKKST